MLRPKMKRRRKSYHDPDPGRRRTHRRGPRKGVEPAGLRRWRLSHRRTHDPGYMRSMHRGPRGGTYFAGPKKRRYDPERFAKLRAYGRRHPRFAGAIGKIEHALGGGWGTGLGAGLAALAGIWTGWKEYETSYGYGGKNIAANYFNTIIGGDIKDKDDKVLRTAVPEVSHLWDLDSTHAYYLPNYLKYKLLGIDPTSGKYVGSAWVIPFWASIAGWIFSKLPLGSKLKRIQKPVNAISKGALVISTIGALALPGSPGQESAYGNIPYASRGYNEPKALTSPASQDGKYHNI